MISRKLGRLSSTYLVRIAEGLALSTKRESLDAEARRRLHAVRAAAKPLAIACDERTIDKLPATTIGKLDARVGRRWSVLRNLLVELARLEAIHPLGAEARSLLRSYFPNGVAFLDFPAQLQLRHSRALLTELERATMTAPLRAIAAPLLAGIREDQTHYQRALDEALICVKPSPVLATLRKPALEALAAFVEYVAVMARGESGAERAARILAPVDTVLAALRVAGTSARSREAKLTRETAKVEPAPMPHEVRLNGGAIREPVGASAESKRPTLEHGPPVPPAHGKMPPTSAGVADPVHEPDRARAPSASPGAA